MPSDADTGLQRQKVELRRQGYATRRATPHKEQASTAALVRLQALPEYAAANTVMWYLHCRSELRTYNGVKHQLGTSKRIVVPYCTVDDAGENRLGLWRLQSMQELVAGMWSILEPPSERWNEAGRSVQPHELDLVVVPGVGFDRRGERLGNGQGYYDRLLPLVRPDALLVGLCYESQLVPEIPVGPNDYRVHKVVTERTVYTTLGARRTL
jgi:5-formyltetrahydrofolate cyclo-ligase